MIRTLEATYENGILKLSAPLPLPEKTQVTVTVQSATDGERDNWMQVSEDALTKTWDNPDDDIFNELLKK